MGAMATALASSNSMGAKQCSELSAMQQQKMKISRMKQSPSSNNI